MDFTESPEIKAIRAGVRQVGAAFPPKYWHERASTKTFPVGFC